MNDFYNGTDMLKTAAATAKREIMNLNSTGAIDLDTLKKLFITKIDNSNTDIKISEADDYLFDKHVQIIGTNDYKSIFNKDKLESFIYELHKDSRGKKIIGYQLIIPRPTSRTAVKIGSHAVALVLNPIKKRIIYHDSTGFDIPQELKIIFNKCFKDYTVIDYHDKSQFSEEKNDGSCRYLSLLNIYYRILDELDKQPDTELDFSAFAGKDYKSDTRSEKFREYLWKEFKDELLVKELNRIKKEEQDKKFEQKPHKQFVFVKSATPEPVIESSDYQLYLDPKFESWVENLAKSLNSQNDFARLNTGYQK